MKLINRIKEDGIDILIELGLFTMGGKISVLAYKPAPITVAGIGLATTTGTTAVDYLIADNYVLPPEYRQYYPGI